MTQGNTPMPELLAPAGGPAAFRAALAAGADAIYCGLGNDFNARRGAANFDDESFRAACHAAHVAGTRVYVTINVVIKSAEMGRALALVRRAWLLGADAFIIQDWGLLAEVRRLWPQVECHISTQANVHDARGTEWCRDLGAERVTLSRELSLPEIATIGATGVETEVFGHGALCFCYSGVCLLSSMSGGRSANRGLCAQPCRLPYILQDRTTGRRVAADGRDRPLCPRDACTVDDVDELAAARAGSLKVEGRMKAPDYVLSVASVYREVLDDLEAGREVPDEVADARRTRLKRAFNRDFTDAYLRGTAGDEMMSYERSNNRGQVVGEVVSSRRLPDATRRSTGTNGGRQRNRRTTRAEVMLRLDLPVGKGDLLEFRPDDDPDQFLTAHVEADACAGQTICCVAARPMPAGCPVRLIRCQTALDAAARLENAAVLRRRPVRVHVVARLGEPFRVELETVPFGRHARDVVRASAEGFVVEAARTKAVTTEELREHAGRLGTSPFEALAVDVDLDEGCGMGFSAVHKVRAAAADALERAILEPWDSRELDAVGRVEVACGAKAASALSAAAADAATAVDGVPGVAADCEVCVIAPTAEVAEAAVASGAARVYVWSADLDAAGATPDGLASGSSVFPAGSVAVLDEVCREPDHTRLDPWVRAGQPVAVGNVSELVLAHERGAAAELRHTIPVHNMACLRALHEAGATAVWLSPELTLGEIELLASEARELGMDCGLVAYGRQRVMTSEHCVLKAADRCVHDCSRCPLRARDLGIRNIDGDVFPVRTDLLARSRVYAARPLDAVPQACDLARMGVGRLAVDATLLSADKCAREVRRLVAALGGAYVTREAGCDSGHLFRGIE